MRLLVSVLVILIALAYNGSLKEKDASITNEKKEEAMHIYSENNSLLMNWPSFNDTSYIYILGLFVKQDDLILTTAQERAMFMSAILLSQQYNITINGKPFAYRLEETNGLDPINALYRTCSSISENEILGIIGPMDSYETKTIARFANEVGLPVISYSSTDPSLSNLNAYRTFYRMSVSDMIIADALLKLFQKYQWNSTIIIYQDDNYGQGGLKALTESFYNKIQIASIIKYDFYTKTIDSFRKQLEESSSRIVLVWANSNVTTNIIELALHEGNILGPDFLWIIQATKTQMNFNNKELTGTLLIRPVPPQIFNIPINNTLLQDAINIWKTYDSQSYQNTDEHIDAYALYTFDSAWMLILALNELCQKNSNDCPSLVNNSYCFVSSLINENKLHTLMRTTNFIGVSGHVQFQENTTDRLREDISYFIIDNLQPSKSDLDQLDAVEVLKFNGNINNRYYKITNEWIELENPIQWPRGIGEESLGYPSLTNHTLNITVYISPPFYMEKYQNSSNGIKTYEPDGYIYDLILLLEERMKFRRNIIVAPMNISYNELVDCVHNGTYEIVMADLTQTASRSEKVDFSVSIYNNELRIIVRRSKKMTIPIMAFLKPFHYSLWLVILVIYFISSICIAGFEFYGTENEQVTDSNDFIYDNSRRTTLFRSMYHTIAALLERESPIQPRTLSARLQTVNIWFVSVVLIALFTSNMVQYFSAQYKKSSIQSIEDLKMCGQLKCNRIGIVEDSHHADYFKKEVTYGVDVNYYRLKHPIEAYDKLSTHMIDAAIVDSSTADYFTQTDYCDLEIAGLPFAKTELGIVVPKQWPYKDHLDKTLIDIKESRAFENIFSKWFQQKHCDRKNELKDDAFDQSLTIIQAQGLFYVFAAFTFFNILLFIVNLIRRRREKRLINPEINNTASADDTPTSGRTSKSSTIHKDLSTTNDRISSTRDRLTEVSIDIPINKPSEE